MAKTQEQLRKERIEVIRFHLESAIQHIDTIDEDADHARAEARNEVNIALEWLEEIQ